ncbi:MAG: VWA domain-containing protein [Saprospiraceae bacterium]
MNKRWNFVLGLNEESSAVELSAEDSHIEKLLETAYGKGKEGGFGKSSHKVRKWLEGIRKYFSSEVVSILQKDALERQGAKEMMLEPELLEQIEPDINLVAIILSLEYLLPDKTRMVARNLVDRLIRKTQAKLRTKLINAVRRGLTNQSKIVFPHGSRIDWRKTIGRNIKHYQQSLNKIIPHTWYGYKSGNKLKEVFLLIDKSESMIHSAIHASIIGSILASIKSIRTHLVFFDTEISDVTEKYQDPIDILFSVPMGGGTDIGLAIDYVDQKMKNHSESLLFLISDLDEGGNKQYLIDRIEILKSKGVHIQVLLCMDNEGAPEYNRPIAEQIASLKIPVYAANPEDFPDILCDQLAKS